MPRTRTLLLTLDAFNTLFHPRLAVPTQYAETAHQFGLPASRITPQTLQPAFKETFKAHAARYPNYGRQLAVLEQYGGPRQWWEEVIRGSFARALNGAGHNDADAHVPDALVTRLLDRFTSSEGYALYPDAQEFLGFLHTYKSLLASGPEREGGASSTAFHRIIVGVLSNSDDRVPAVLRSLGLDVGSVRADQGVESMRLPGFEERGRSNSSAPTISSARFDLTGIRDIDMVITSYQAGAEKPSPMIFEIAKRQAMRLAGVQGDESDWTCVHVGDDFEKDFQGALSAGWDSYHLSREEIKEEVKASKRGRKEEKNVKKDPKKLQSLQHLYDILGDGTRYLRGAFEAS